ncbi:SRPBCC family protein [Panacibacter sp. DH6]|uniref:SRPBCC family protein n=1 Tax=Panacibacter microcysteis TaxID=2793269 RepID=A0A931E7X5_9BACT|nr:SRPBCC family protein [Panacibacter microcysteis]MBG9377852.1 SRPBCC family protein [Panacibacter microcysteis]
MKKFLKILLIAIVSIVAIVLIAALFAPKELHIERDVTINAPKEKVWSNVGSLHGMHSWSPWIEADPAINITYEGNDGTPGAIYKWKGNSDVGEGEQTITKTDAPNSINTHVHFIKPFEGEADASIVLEDAGNSTKATWTFDSKYAYPMNVMLLLSMDDMIGDTYSKGLNKLKTMCEAN